MREEHWSDPQVASIAACNSIVIILIYFLGFSIQLFNATMKRAAIETGRCQAHLDSIVPPPNNPHSIPMDWFLWLLKLDWCKYTGQETDSVW